MTARIIQLDAERVTFRGTVYTREQCLQEHDRLSRSGPLTQLQFRREGTIPEAIITKLFGSFGAWQKMVSISPRLTIKGESELTDADGVLLQKWTKTTREGRSEAEVLTLPDPKTVVKESRLLDQDGKVVQQWISTKPDLVQREHLWQVAADELGKSIEYRVQPVPVQEQVYANRCVVVPVGDHHIGMWTSLNEGSGDWNLELAESVLMASLDELLASTTPSEQCVLATMGDWFHFDGLRQITPRHGNILDACGRYDDSVRVGMRLLRRCVDRCLQRHKKVRLVVSAGNHDEASSVMLRCAMSNIYENEPRLVVDGSPKAVHVVEWHKNLIAFHHGDQVKMDKLQSVVSGFYPEVWGRTTFRLALTGHVHHLSRKEYTGLHVESVGVLAPSDAYAESHGYRSDRTLIAIVLDPTRGEIARHTMRVQ